MKRRALFGLLPLTCLLLAAPTGLVAQPAEAPAPQAEARVLDQAREHYLRGLERLCGTRVQRDPALAALWVRMAAEEGHLEAQGLLGWMFMTGTGLPRDDGRAMDWLRRAAERGSVAAQNNLGVLYATGAGVESDAAEAARWFRAAAAKGAEAAARNLATLERQAGARGGASARGPSPTARVAMRPAPATAVCRSGL